MHPCSECGQSVSRRGHRAADLAFHVLSVRDQLAQYAPRHQDLSEICAVGEDLARHLHVTAHGSSKTAPLFSRRAKKWLRDGSAELQEFIQTKESPATWEPIPRRTSTGEGVTQPPDSTRVQIPV